MLNWYDRELSDFDDSDTEVGSQLQEGKKIKQHIGVECKLCACSV